MNAYEMLHLFILALAVYRESRGESYQGKLAVAHVILNRVRDARWPDTVRDVILQPWQFSAFNKNDSQVTVFPKAEFDSAWEESFRAAQEALAGGVDLTHGSNHYLNAETVLKTSGALPTWAKPEAKILTIGSHDFYKL